MHLKLLPVHSKLADPTTLPPKLVEAVPQDWALSQHQVDTYNALLNPDVDVVINTAMTGDGKSLAGQLPLLLNQQHTLALYPTNELIQDQYQNIQQAFPRWNVAPNNTARLYGARLDELADEATFGGRSEQLLQLLKNHQLVLSNPDIFHTIMQFGYQKGIAPDWLAGPLREHFNQITFDEFHIFDVTQGAAVLTALLFLYVQRGSYPLKTLFLSATPGETLLPLLNRAGFQNRVKVIEGIYSYDADADPDQWRPILQPATLQLVPQPEGGIETWIAAHLEDTILAFFREHGKRAKGAIIVNSVATAHRLLATLAEPFRREGLTVLPNTGLTDRAHRADSYNADVLIGTSTIDIGVDFQISFLVFEGSDASNFMQRLGRLGRHTQYTDAAGTTHSFAAFACHALIPNFVYSRLAIGYKDAPALLTNGDSLRRDTLRVAIQSAFPPPARYDRYLADWGCFQPAKVLYALVDRTIKETYAAIVPALEFQYKQVFGVGMRKSISKAAALRREGNGALVDEASLFRGSSPFDCGIYMPDQHEPLSYNLLWLLANTRLQLLTEEEFCSEATRRGYNPKPFMRGYQIAFAAASEFLPHRENVVINLDRVRDVVWATTHYGQAQVITGIQLDCGGFADLNRLNRQLVQRKFVALIQPGIHPRDMQRAAYLPGMFPLYLFEGAGLTGTIAFGRQALILDTVLRYRKVPSSVNDAPMFC